MAGERVTIQVESNIGEDGPLTVMDTLHQFMDAFELLSAAIAAESDGEKVRWRLVSMSKNSPATATAEAFCDDPAITVGPLVYRGKKRFSADMAALSQGDVSPWLGEHKGLARSLLMRNLNGIGRTVFDLDGDAPRTVVVEKAARSGLTSIDRFEASQRAEAEDKSRSERGTIDANVVEAKTYHGRPALYVRERLSGRTVRCLLTAKGAEIAGPTHSWQDAWTGRRVRVKGEIFYDISGQVSHVGSASVVDVHSSPVDLADLKRIDILQGATPTKHVDALWGYSDD